MSQSGQSKFPDFKEVAGMAGKLLKDVKTSITEIIDDYKAKRNDDVAQSTQSEHKTSTQASSSSQQTTTTSSPPNDASTTKTHDDSSKPE